MSPITSACFSRGRRAILIASLPHHDQEAVLVTLQGGLDGKAVSRGNLAGALVPFEDVETEALGVVSL
jgi:hypothetical protein